MLPMANTIKECKEKTTNIVWYIRKWKQVFVSLTSFADDVAPIANCGIPSIQNTSMEDRAEKGRDIHH
uniref:Uncharacterized protein n=1 Tax=Arion vulgaris TaxID=1028688 RepID=A0A0B7A9H1_9EUPU